jgi:hypothetical protein
MVLLPKLEYILANVCLEKRNCDTIHQPMLRLIKWKMDLPSTCANTTLWHKEICEVISLCQKHIESQISELFIRINTNGLVGTTTLIRLKQFQIDICNPTCMLTAEDTKIRKIKHRNLGAKVLQQAKRLGLNIAVNEFTSSWNILSPQEESKFYICNILEKYDIKGAFSSISTLNLWHINQLFDLTKEKMLTWRQLKIKVGRSRIGKKAK